ncbi:DUF4124 domain-containing protein [Colwellia hornerae]|uniref:DUF4124 domain-containing protein n=1 Tax=Colwellia hornerae TaxID=89402 RepID=A0A5C6Q8N1_9GAMM|nr:DUF4124 domain-containing protein [Colwellia hornerae]TWX50678.1 DUF4124 domain-containing protein [Colwellia hornerae]TWX56420.1 DUF4124 domain-containing protein [Colwellia hornerae]TWX65394.1 DUF4124 domain-containing protein [Colwellia hornerae]
MNFRILLLGLIFYFGYCSASELMIYRWVDKDNVVHFSQHQPIGDEYTQFLVSNQSSISSRADLITGPLVSDKDIASQQNTDNIAATIDMPKKCLEAQENLAMLTAFDKVQYTDEKGSKQILTETEKQQQLAINQKRTEVYCASLSE